MLMPKRVKYRRVHRGRMKGKATRGNTVTYGEFGLVAQEPCWMTANQIEAARRAMTRYIKRGGNIWIKVFPDKQGGMKRWFSNTTLRTASSNFSMDSRRRRKRKRAVLLGRPPSMFGVRRRRRPTDVSWTESRRPRPR